MAKLLYLAFIYMTVSIAFAHHGGSWFGSLFHPTPSTICTTNATRTAYLNQTLTAINAFQTNATSNSTLQQRFPSFVAYVTNSTNKALLNTNCTAFVNGVVAAKLADNKANYQVQHVADTMGHKFDQIPRNVTGSQGANDMDVRESGGHHHHH